MTGHYNMGSLGKSVVCIRNWVGCAYARPTQFQPIFAAYLGGV